MALGYTKQLEEDHYLQSPSQLNDRIAVLLSGHAAEKLIYGESASGVQDDIKRATYIARTMVTELGMSEKLGPRTFGTKQELVFLGREISEQKDYSDATALLIDQEVDKIIEIAYKVCTDLLTENKEVLIKLTETLINKETLDFDDLEALFKEMCLKNGCRIRARVSPARKSRREVPPEGGVEGAWGFTQRIVKSEMRLEKRFSPGSANRIAMSRAEW